MIPVGTPIAARRTMTTPITHNRQPNELAGVPPAGIKKNSAPADARSWSPSEAARYITQTLSGFAPNTSKSVKQAFKLSSARVSVDDTTNIQVRIDTTNLTTTTMTARPAGTVAVTIGPGKFEVREISSDSSCWTVRPHEMAHLILNGPLAGMNAADIAHWTTLAIENRGAC